MRKKPTNKKWVLQKVDWEIFMGMSIHFPTYFKPGISQKKTLKNNRCDPMAFWPLIKLAPQRAISPPEALLLELHSRSAFRRKIPGETSEKAGGKNGRSRVLGSFRLVWFGFWDFVDGKFWQHMCWHVLLWIHSLELTYPLPRGFSRWFLRGICQVFTVLVCSICNTQKKTLQKLGYWLSQSKSGGTCSFFMKHPVQQLYGCKQLPTFGVKTNNLLGGFNPFEKLSQIESFPQVSR